MRFLGLQLEDRVPDAKTVWLFRERLKETKLIDVLFTRFDEQLASHGLSISLQLFPVSSACFSSYSDATPDFIGLAQCFQFSDLHQNWQIKHAEFHVSASSGDHHILFKCRDAISNISLTSSFEISWIGRPSLR